MSAQITHYKVMIGSPSDLVKERMVVKKAIEGWNKLFTNLHRIQFDAFTQEDAVPLIANEEPQAILDKQLSSQTNLMIALFWTRAGTPISCAVSGTMKEIQNHLDTKRPVLLYFFRKKSIAK